MKTQRLFLLFIVLIISVHACSPSPNKAKTITVKASALIEEKISVRGMTCVGCEVTLEESLSKIDGVVSVKASHHKKQAVIEFDSTQTNITAIKKAVKEAGYKTFD